MLLFKVHLHLTVFLLSWVGWDGKIEVKVHISPTEAETGTELRNRRLNHQPDQFSLKILSYQVKSLLSRVDGWVGEWGKIKIKDHLSPAEAEIGAELGNMQSFELRETLSI